MNNIKHMPYGAPNEKSKWHDSYGVFTQEQDNDKTTTSRMLNLCIPMMPCRHQDAPELVYV